MKDICPPYCGINVGDTVEYSPVSNIGFGYKNCKAKGLVTHITKYKMGGFGIQIKQISEMTYNIDKSFYKIGSVTTGCYGAGFAISDNLKLIKKGKNMKNFMFYFLKKPSFHFYKDDFVIELSLGFLNFLYVR